MQQQFRKGDLVLVPGVVKYDQSKPESVYVDVQYQGFAVTADELKLVRPFFAVGDEAWRPAGIDGKELEKVTVLAVHDEMVWVRDESGSFASLKAVHLTRKLKPLEPEQGKATETPVVEA
ncbi:hypothetical protein PMI07_000815 [Rhizobium sp. CF080]|uniref:hypothetical protein n=1 Tax=Rhizobium sp. (strain CF080) TaxID=1144310 RepID=UPI000271D615|nr:hypothetical protein [Rhizobium sp. CF080]EUB97239.1 hypothetical protein PMI07_000815 [Rhizobium sp. CF080]